MNDKWFQAFENWQEHTDWLIYAGGAVLLLIIVIAVASKKKKSPSISRIQQKDMEDTLKEIKVTQSHTSQLLEGFQSAIQEKFDEFRDKQKLTVDLDKQIDRLENRMMLLKSLPEELSNQIQKKEYRYNMGLFWGGLFTGLLVCAAGFLVYMNWGTIFPEVLNILQVSP
ncbi:hypothetical protein BC781_10985 [Sediminitomix flava]|uniref:Uncharacterized protein n=2 Tax=Sediminitomix flava TaxID=379075 RepID=A0A315Z1S3_SEDFL|nr:hypothetical protein BC781_10985 [Sediminitomix flava]